MAGKPTVATIVKARAMARKACEKIADTKCFGKKYLEFLRTAGWDLDVAIQILLDADLVSIASEISLFQIKSIENNESLNSSAGSKILAAGLNRHAKILRVIGDEPLANALALSAKRIEELIAK